MSNKQIIRIINRHMKGSKVVAYGVEVIENGINMGIMTIAKDIVHQKAYNGEVINCAGQKYNGEIIIKGVGCKLSELPVIDVETNRLRKNNNLINQELENKLELIARVATGKSITGYVARDRNNKKYKIGREDTLSLAKKGSIINARVQMSNGIMILRGVGCDLAKLPLMKAE